MHFWNIKFQKQICEALINVNTQLLEDGIRRVQTES